MNEIDTIKYTLEELSQANSKLDEHVRGSLPIMRDNLLFELVSGHIPDWENFEQEARRVGIRFHHDNYTVAVLSLRSGWSRAGQDIGLSPGLRGTLPDDAQGYFFKSIYQQELILVCSHTADFLSNPA